MSKAENLGVGGLAWPMVSERGLTSASVCPLF